MDTNFFKKESHEYLDSLFEDFKAYKSKVFDIFKVFDQTCRNNNIEYFVSCGSLLGIIRDGGSIPWDYDMDVGVRITDVDRLIDVLKTKLPEGYYFESNFTNKRYPFYQIRILKKGEESLLVHLDVFYFIGAPDENTDSFADSIRMIFTYRFNYWNIQNGSKSTLARIVKTILLKSKYKFKGIHYMNKKFNKLVKLYDYNTAKNIAIMGINGEIIPYDAIEPINHIVADGYTYPIPNNPDRFLSCFYKNYHEYLPISSRFHEFYDITRMYNKCYGKDKEVLYRVKGDN